MDFILVRAHAQGANSWHLKGFESGWGKRFNESVEYLLKAATSGHFEKILEIYSPWYTDKKRYGTKKTLPSTKVIEGFRAECNEHGQSIMTGGDIRQMKDADAKRLLSFALARTILRHGAFCGQK